jgi:radical SAM superfamily enzyme YgiQ (UPF0313 family)
MNSKNQLCVKLVHCGNINVINPRDKEQKNTFFMPMGLFALAGVLKQNQFDTEIIHLDFETDKKITEILDFDEIDVIGFDCHWVNQGRMVLEIAALIKSIRPGIFILLGGFTASLFTHEILSTYPQVDLIIRGDAEEPVVRLCQVIREEKLKKSQFSPNQPPGLFRTVQNLAWKEGNNEIRMNDISYVATAENLEKLDFAAIDLLRDWEKYVMLSRYYSNFKCLNATPVFFLEVGRGCQYACTFCGGNCVAQERMNNRKHTVIRSVDSVLETMKKAMNFGYRMFFVCLEYEGSDEWHIQLLDRVREENLSISFGYGCWRLPSRPLIDAVASSCQQGVIEISPETGSIELRKKNKDMRLYYSNRDLTDCLDYISQKDNLKVQLYFGYFLASDTEETIMYTIEFAIDMLIRYHRIMEVEYSNFSTDPGSLLFFYPEKYNIDIKVKNFNDYMEYLKKYYVDKKGQSADMTLFRPKELPAERVDPIHRKMMLFNFLFSSYRKSVSYILEKNRTPAVIMEFLNSNEIPLNDENQFPRVLVKDSFTDLCRKHHLLDLYLLKLIDYEYQKQKERRISKPTSQLYLDFEKVEHLHHHKLLEDMSREEVEPVLLESLVPHYDIEAEFDI